MKLTAALLALIASVALSTSASANAASTSLILGVFDSDGVVTNSYEADLGKLTSLTDGETFSVGSTLAAAFASDSSPTLEFDIFSANTVNSTIAVSTTGSITVPGSSATQKTDIAAVYAGYTPAAPAATSGAFTDFTIANSSNDSFDKAVVAGGSSFGLGSDATPNILTAYAPGNVVELLEYTNGGASTTELGSFKINSDDSITYSVAVAPEPSTYALMGLSGLIGLVMMKRRQSNA